MTDRESQSEPVDPIEQQRLDELEQGRMSWREHVEDLRHSLMVSSGSFLVIFLVSLFFLMSYIK